MVDLPREFLETPAGRFEIVVRPYGTRKARFYAVVNQLLPADGRFATVLRLSRYSGLDGMGAGLTASPAIALAHGRAFVDAVVA